MTLIEAKRVVGGMFAYMTWKKDGTSKWYLYGKFTNREAVIAEAERLVAEKRKKDALEACVRSDPRHGRAGYPGSGVARQKQLG